MHENSNNVDKKIEKFGYYSIEKTKYNLMKEISINNYVISRKWIGKLFKEKDKFKIYIFATYVSVKYRIIDIDTQISKMVVEYFNGMELVTRCFDSFSLSKTEVKEFLKYGICFCDTASKTFLDYLTFSAVNAPVKYSYSTLGFGKSPAGERIFKSYHSIGGKQDMNYHGNLVLKPCGTLDKWLSMIKEEVIGNIPLTFVLCCGFASPILQYLNENQDIGSIIFNLANQSSTGKTTAMMLAVSAFSKPELNDGTMMNYYSTDNSKVELISSCQGFTVGLDEAGMNKSKNSTALLYAICSGRSKVRMNSQSEICPVKRFSSVVISTAEFEILNAFDPDGIKVRVFEIKDRLTVSAEQSDKIKHTVISNYAVAGDKYIDCLLSSINSIDKDYEKTKEELITKCLKVNGLTKRILSKLAIVLLAAKYIEQAFDITLNIQELQQYALKLEKNISNENKPEDRLLQIIQDEFVLHSSNYSIDNNDMFGKGYGIIKKSGTYIEYYISKPVFEQIVIKYNLTNYKSILDNLKKRNILICESDRLTIRVVLIKGVNRQVCYGFRLPDDSTTNTIPNDLEEQPKLRRIISSPVEEFSINEKDIDIVIDNELTL